MPQLVFVHGRSQENKQASDLKEEWMRALDAGLAKSNLSLPIPKRQVRFPYYGQTLFDLASGVEPEEAAKIIVRGAAEDARERAFMISVLREVQEKAGISDEQIRELTGEDEEVIQRGVLNNRFVMGLLRGIDRFVPGGSGTAIGLATKDVYAYIGNPALRARINEGVRSAMKPGVPTVVVAHSLGTVVAYTLLKEEGKANNWDVPLLVTLGSPLSVTAIKRPWRPTNTRNVSGNG